MKQKYMPENFRYMSASRMVGQLDYLVKDPEDPNYLVLKGELQKIARKAEDHNPFGAGRSERFDEAEKRDMADMKINGNTYRQIADYYDCSVSMTYKCVDEVNRAKRRVRK